MNDERRKALVKAVHTLEVARNMIDEVKGEEESAYESMPESMQQGDKGEKAQAAIEALTEASDAIEQAIDHVSTASE